MKLPTVPWLAWHTGRVARHILYCTGLARLRLGGFSMRQAARAAGRYMIVKLILPFCHGPYIIQGHSMYIAGGPNVLLPFKLAVDKFEPATTDLFKRLLRDGMTCIDVGAHVGYFTLLAARLVGSAGQVYAFEAEPSTYDVLVRNVQLNQYRNILPLNQAIGDRSGRAELFLSNRSGTGVSRWNRLYSGGELGPSILVTTTTLDEFLAKEGEPRVDLVKMDIDGGEVLALRGMMNLLSRAWAPKLIIEFYPEGLQACGANPLDLPAKLMDLGFTIYVIGEAEMTKVSTPQYLLTALDWERGASVNLLCEKTSVTRL